MERERISSRQNVQMESAPTEGSLIDFNTSPPPTATAFEDRLVNNVVSVLDEPIDAPQQPGE